MDWLDAHSGSVQAIATLVLVGLTGYYAYTSRALVRETRATLAANARLTLQARFDRVSELFVRSPHLFQRLNDPEAHGDEEDERFFIAGIVFGVLEEAHTQYTFEHSMSQADWQAWIATTDALINRRYMRGYWQRSRAAFNSAFADFLDGRLAAR